MGAAEERRTTGPQETEALAAALAAQLRPGDVVVISGDLGAGKTTFVRGACRALGVTGRVTSPTFTIARRYEDGRVPISHVDLYRLEGGHSLPHGLVKLISPLTILEDKKAICLWGSMFGELHAVV